MMEAGSLPAKQGPDLGEVGVEGRRQRDTVEA